MPAAPTRQDAVLDARELVRQSARFLRTPFRGSADSPAPMQPRRRVNSAAAVGTAHVVRSQSSQHLDNGESGVDSPGHGRRWSGAGSMTG